MLGAQACVLVMPGLPYAADAGAVAVAAVVLPLMLLLLLLLQS